MVFTLSLGGAIGKLAVKYEDIISVCATAIMGAFSQLQIFCSFGFEFTKNLAGIPLNDVLFLQKKGDDLVIANDACVTLKNGDQLHSQPAADYGNEAWLADADLDVSDAELRAQTNGWTWLIIRGFALPRGYSPQSVDLLVKLPPLFPEAAPDMFWVSPAVRAPGGRNPRATSSEVLLGASWQRFSWHLAKGAWAPGRSTLRDYLRCIRGRFQRGD